jgi:hypothetical protein
MRAGILSFRLGGADGVSVAADGLAASLRALGFETATIAGEGGVDRLVPGLARSAGAGPDLRAVRWALADLDLVVVENLLTLPLHPPASRIVAQELAGRRAVIRHHDPPWQRERFRHVTELPMNSPGWVHTAVCDHTRDELAARGFDASTLHVGLRPPGGPADRGAVRNLLGVDEGEFLCLHPVRAVRRKEIPGAIELTRRLGGAYWLTAAAEEGYRAEAVRQLRTAPVRTIWRPFDDIGLDAAYAASDLVVFPSSWEGFGIPPLEAALRRRPVAVGHYPAAEELRAMGFDWPSSDDPVKLRELMRDEVSRMRLIDRNEAVARRYFTTTATTRQLGQLLSSRGWLSEAAEGRAV